LGTDLPGGQDFRREGVDQALPTDFAKCRKTYFPVPLPGLEGYSSNMDMNYPDVGFLGNYYSWNWGSAFFVVLDPYWYTTTNVINSAWEWTLGKNQYDWLAENLNFSHAVYKFIFIHQFVGGVFGSTRGYGGYGDEHYASFFEWGGLNEDGSEGFLSNRPGWVHGPIHEILKSNLVSVVFKGHDHLYHVGSKDGVIYNTLPKTSVVVGTRNDVNIRSKGYNPEEVPSLESGHAEVLVEEAVATVRFISYRGVELFAYDVVPKRKTTIK